MSDQHKIINYLNSNTFKINIISFINKHCNNRSRILKRILLKFTSDSNINIDEDVKKIYIQYKRNHLSNSGQFITKLLKIMYDERMNDTYMEDVVEDTEVVIKRKKKISKTNNIIILHNNHSNLTIINQPSSQCIHII
jgi:hypothetical protein